MSLVPPPRYGFCLGRHFYREKTATLSSLDNSRLMVPAHATKALSSMHVVLFYFANKGKMSPRWDGTNMLLILVVAFEAHHHTTRATGF